MENPWWDSGQIDPHYAQMSPRAYFEVFEPLVRNLAVKRAVVLMGPRRVGKTVLVHHVIQRLIASGVNPRKISYLSIENPTYNGLGLEELFARCRAASGEEDARGHYVFFDEIQYLRDWEVHLKSLVDSYHQVKCVASGSAAAALRLKSIESGAGRFTDFLLPPLTFHEYLTLVGKDSLIDVGRESRGHGTTNISALNQEFIEYLNYGGYPEAVVSPQIRSNPERFIRSDIVDKVLLRDLPSLYGIADIQELNSLFTMLAFNTAQEVSLEQLSQRSGVAKNTLKRYIEYLEAAFLIKRVNRVDRSARRFQRATAFKVYLTTPSIRNALFSPISADSGEMGSLVETAVFSQWFHSPSFSVYYARWSSGKVDLVYLSTGQKVVWAVETKWSDRALDSPGEMSALVEFCKTHGLKQALLTTRTLSGARTVDGVQIELRPAALYCYTVGYNAVVSKAKARDLPVRPGPAEGPA